MTEDDTDLKYSQCQKGNAIASNTSNETVDSPSNMSDANPKVAEEDSCIAASPNVSSVMETISPEESLIDVEKKLNGCDSDELRKSSLDVIKSENCSGNSGDSITIPKEDDAFKAGLTSSTSACDLLSKSNNEMESDFNLSDSENKAEHCSTNHEGQNVEVFGSTVNFCHSSSLPVNGNNNDFSKLIDELNPVMVSSGSEILLDIAPCSPESANVYQQNSQVESLVLKQLNDALSNLGFGFRREIENDTSKPLHLDCNNLNQKEDELGNNQALSVTLQEFSSNLVSQLSKFKLEAEKFRNDHYSEVQSLERVLAQERLRMEQQETKALLTITQLKTDLEKKQQLLEAANKDREGMVVKYAMSEKNVITVRKDLEVAERRLREANRARDLLSERLKVVQSEKEKANNLLETKGQEYSTVNRENQRLKEDLRWTQNKLKTEVDNKKEAEQRIMDLIRKLEEARLEVEQARKDAQNAIKEYQESQENKAVSLDQQLREHHARLILERHERADNEAVLKQLQTEVDALKTKQQTLINENNQLSIKVQTLEKERLDSDQRLSRLKQDNDKHLQEVADLRERLAGMESLRAQMQQYEDQLSTCRNEMERLRSTNIELQHDAAACREREAELLDFTQKLTEKNVRLQSEFSALEAKTQVLESEQQPLLRKLGDAESRSKLFAQQLDEEKQKRQEENSILARHLAEKTHSLEQVQQQLEDCQGEVEVLKRKHAASIRELTREIQQSRKRQEMAENASGGSHHSSDTSLASSSSSLHNVCETTQSPAIPPITLPNGQEPDRQTLIERLIRLQRENAKRAEKLDFMEEHSQVLVSELQKKTRLIQNFIMKMPAGALSSESMDQNKAELAKRSGVMASMYGSKNDETMTMELSMEINRKLQAVLEDTLLKNITLKENLDTLGAEIARLSTKGATK